MSAKLERIYHTCIFLFILKNKRHLGVELPVKYQYKASELTQYLIKQELLYVKQHRNYCM